MLPYNRVLAETSFRNLGKKFQKDSDLATAYTNIIHGYLDKGYDIKEDDQKSLRFCGETSPSLVNLSNPIKCKCIFLGQKHLHAGQVMLCDEQQLIMRRVSKTLLLRRCYAISTWLTY